MCFGEFCEINTQNTHKNHKNHFLPLRLLIYSVCITKTYSYGYLTGSSVTIDHQPHNESHNLSGVALPGKWT